MARSSSPTGQGFEEKMHALEGVRVHAVDYWGVHNFDTVPARWDYGDWHHAVMGLQLSTDAGPFTVTWTNTFYPYGVEVFPDPIERHLILRPDGPERVGPDGLSRWAPLLDSPVRNVMVWWDRWDRLDLGPDTTRFGEVGTPARSVELPTALRLDFDAGPVWLAAAMPQAPTMEEVFIPGDEIMVVFTAEKLRAMGFVDERFVP